MSALLQWSRMRISLPVRPAPPAAPVIPSNWLVLGVVAGVCFGLWITSVQVLLTSHTREGGRLLACRYFTGVRITERQFLDTGRGSDRRECPVVRLD